MRRTAGCVLVSSLLACAGCGGGTDRFTYSGTVQADSAAIGSTVGGRVWTVAVADGDRVTAHEIVVRLDDRQARAAYDTALAQAQQADAALRDLEAGPRPADIEKAAASAQQAEASYRRAALQQPSQEAAASQAVHAAQANAAAARTNARSATNDYLRAQILFAQGAISAQSLDSARAAAASARGAAASAAAQLRTAQAQLASVTAGSAAEDVASAASAAAAAEANLTLVREGTRPDQIAEARAAAQAADASVAAAAARLDEATVRSPAAGIVEALDLHPGDIVAPGASVATIEEFTNPWVRIYVTQSDMQRARVGARVQVRADALQGRIFDGRIEAIDTTAQFTPRDVQTQSDRADLTFGVKVRIDDPAHALLAGTTVEVALP